MLYLAQLSFNNVNNDGNGLQFRSDLRVDSKPQAETDNFPPATRTQSYADSFQPNHSPTHLSASRTTDNPSHRKSATP